MEIRDPSNAYQAIIKNVDIKNVGFAFDKNLEQYRQKI